VLVQADMDVELLRENLSQDKLVIKAVQVVPFEMAEKSELAVVPVGQLAVKLVEQIDRRVNLIDNCLLGLVDKTELSGKLVPVGKN
jgi:hypothetical protein